MKRLVPTAADLFDAAMVAALGMLALLGFATTFEGTRYLVVGAAGLGIGLLLAHLATGLRQPVVVLAAVVLIAYFAAGPPLLLPHEPWFDLDTSRTIASAAVLSWKQLLTTVPPVEAGSPLLVIPFLLGLVVGSAGLGAAQRLAGQAKPQSFLALARAALPAAAPMAVLVVVLACGTGEPAARLPDGVAFAVLTLLWTSLRLRRSRISTRRSARRGRRLVLAATVLATAAIASTFGAPFLPGAQAARTVLRDYVVPPFDLSAYPSPLVGFRKYTKDANRLWDQELFRVSGVPDGTSMRIATLDAYDGSVWGAGDEASFKPVSSRISNPPTGSLTTVRVTISAAYAASQDVNAWLPETGVPVRVDFGGPRTRELAASLYYNRGLSAGIVTARLRAGDSYTLSTSLGQPVLPDDLQPYARPALPDDVQAMISSKLAAWTKGATDLTGRIKALAAYLKDNGAYTDGGAGESQYLPGHGMGRLGAFVKDAQPAGDDEQYAALFALATNYIGLPARVVLGARPDASGVVRGRDVHAWVEVHLADGDWAPIPQSQFMPDPSKRPQQKPPQSTENKDTAAVPPPNAGRQPVTTTDTSRVDPFPLRPHEPSLWGRILQIVLAVGVWAGPPLFVMATVVATIRGLKRRRRNRRRTSGLSANRYAGAWQELIDSARDLSSVNAAIRAGVADTRLTRREHAAILDEAAILAPQAFARLAAGIDDVVYGTAEPTAPAAEAFWAETDGIRRQLTAGLNRVQRIRVALSLRSLRPPVKRRNRPHPILAGGRAS